MKVLVTGFGPFPGVDANPSGDVLPLVSGHVSTMLLPVEYDLATHVLCERLVADPPDAAVLLGLAEGERSLRIESLATNLDDSPAPDNAGRVRHGIPVVAGDVSTYRSTLPTGRILAALGGAGFPVATSTDAGGYVCNHVFFQARHVIEERGLSTRCGLVHVPDLDRAGWSLERLAAAVNCCLAAVLADV